MQPVAAAERARRGGVVAGGAARVGAPPAVRQAARHAAAAPPPPHLPLQPQPRQGPTRDQHDGVVRDGRADVAGREARRGGGRRRGEAAAPAPARRRAQAAGPHVRPPGCLKIQPTPSKLTFEFIYVLSHIYFVSLSTKNRF